MQEIRRENIKDLLQQRGSMMIAELSQKLGVSEMTIHRDLDLLQSQGFLIKKRGGAILNQDNFKSQSNYTYNHVKTLYVKEKQEMAKEAFALLNKNETIIFDNSTSACEVAKLLKGRYFFTVIATNPGVFNELASAKNITLYSSGGLYSMRTNSLVGSAAEEFVKRIDITTCILSAACLSSELGATESYPAEASLKRKMIEAADRTLLLADHTKLGCVGTEKIAEFENIDYVITDSGADAQFVKALREKTKVIVCGEQTTPVSEVGQ